MTKKSRTILFLIFSLLFLIIAPFFAMYSQGYRFDFETRKITQTGGLFFKVSPMQAEVIVSGNLAKKTDFFFGSVLVENLLPKSYQIEIKKEGYKPWVKTLEIKAKEVTSAKNIVLFAENYAFNAVAKNIENFWIFPDQKKIILHESGLDGWEIKIYEPEKNLVSILIDQNDIPYRQNSLTDLEFSPDMKEAYLKVQAAGQIKYYLVPLDKPHQAAGRKNPPFFWQNDIITYRISDNAVFYLDKAGDVYKADSSLSLKEKISEKPFRVSPTAQYDFWLFGSRLFISENRMLYQYEEKEKSFIKIADTAADLKISPDGKKIAFFNDNEIWILFLEDIEDQPIKKAGDKSLLGRFSEKIENALWINAHYLALNTGSQIKISEIDDRDKINIVDLIVKENPKIFWDQNNKQLYILSGKTLYQSEKLIK